MSLPILSLNIYKIRHQKTLKMLRLRVLGPPRLAPYQLLNLIVTIKKFKIQNE